MSDTNAVGLFYSKESTAWGETEADPLIALRYAGESLAPELQTIISNEINTDRNVSDVVRTQISASGEVNGEISYGTLDTLLEGGVQEEWSTPITTTASLTAVAAGNKFTGTDWAAAGWVAGMRFKSSGWTDPGNNGVGWVVSANTTDLVVGGLTLVNEGPASRTITNGGMLRNGSVFTSFTLEKQFTDLTNIFHILRGMAINTMGFNVQVGSISTWTAAFLGKSVEAAAATAGTGGPTAANTNDVLNAIDNVTAIYQGGTLSTLDITAISFNMNNNLRARYAIGSASAVGISSGQFNVEGNFTAYFEDSVLFEQFTDFVTTSLSFRLYDAAGNSLMVTLPAIKFTTGRAVAGGKDGDVMAELGFMAKKDATTGCMIQFDRIAA